MEEINIISGIEKDLFARRQADKLPAKKNDDLHNYELDNNLYHIGFYYRGLIYTHNIDIALYFEESDNTFRYCYCLASNECTSNDSYNLVLIKNISRTRAELIIPLRGKPILNSTNELLEEGVQIVGYFDEWNEIQVSLFIGRKKIELPSSETLLLANHVLKSFKESDHKIIYNARIGLKYGMLKEIHRIESEVTQYDLPEILKDLHISVRESFNCRVGRDDYYYVYKTVKIGYPEEKLDSFLKNYIGLGERCIYEDSGYTSAYNLSIKDLIIGEYNEIQVQKEREKLIGEYSAQNHINNNICEYLKEKLSPSGLTHYELCPNIISMERNSLIPLFWKLLRGDKYSRYFDNLDRICSVRGFSDETLLEINDELNIFSKSMKPYLELNCSNHDPKFPIL